jgi:protein-tyrosine phosphatase
MLYILDNLAIGEYEEAISPPAEITALLCVAGERDISKPCLPYHKVPIEDLKPIPQELLVNALDYIESMHGGGHRVLIFCNQGTGRSPSVAIAYLCCRLHYSFGQAVEAVAAKKTHLSILPNLIVSINESRRLQTP